MYYYRRIGHSHFGYAFHVSLLTLVFVWAPAWILWHVIKALAEALFWGVKESLVEIEHLIRWSWREWHQPPPRSPTGKR